MADSIPKYGPVFPLLLFNQSSMREDIRDCEKYAKPTHIFQWFVSLAEFHKSLELLVNWPRLLRDVFAWKYPLEIKGQLILISVGSSNLRRVVLQTDQWGPETKIDNATPIVKLLIYELVHPSIFASSHWLFNFPLWIVIRAYIRSSRKFNSEIMQTSDSLNPRKKRGPIQESGFELSVLLKSMERLRSWIRISALSREVNHLFT